MPHGCQQPLPPAAEAADAAQAHPCTSPRRGCCGAPGPACGGARCAHAAVLLWPAGMIERRWLAAGAAAAGTEASFCTVLHFARCLLVVCVHSFAHFAEHGIFNLALGVHGYLIGARPQPNTNQALACIKLPTSTRMKG
jgi:hypothetical protein